MSIEDHPRLVARNSRERSSALTRPRRPLLYRLTRQFSFFFFSAVHGTNGLTPDSWMVIAHWQDRAVSLSTGAAYTLAF